MGEPVNTRFPDEEMKRRRLAWKEWGLSHEAVPFRLGERHRKQLTEAVPALHRAAVAVTNAFLETPHVREQFGYRSAQEAAILTHPGYPDLIPLGRLDSILTPDGVKFLEYNTDGTAGWHYTSGITALWREREGLPPEERPLVERLVDTVLTCWERWQGRKSDSPNVALVDWEGVGTRPEQEAIRDRFRGRGLRCTLEDPSQMWWKGGALRGSAGPVDLAYRRVVSEELFSGEGRAPEFLEAYAAGGFCCVGGFCTDPAWSKILFALISDPQNEAWFGEQDREVLKRCVPWTRLVTDAPTEWEGKAVSLRDLAEREQGRLLLKPARSYQGAGVTAGPLVDAETWKSAFARASLEPGRWVLQEFVQPVWWEDSATGVSGYLQVGEFTLRGEWAGLMARICESPIINPQVAERFLPIAEELGEEKCDVEGLGLEP